MIDDGGSGFWIAREALKSVLRTEEENPGGGWTSTLGTCLAGALGGEGWLHLVIDEAELDINLTKVVFVRTAADEQRVGFGSA